MFRIGQEIVCIDDSPTEIERLKILKKYEQYTVSGFNSCGTGVMLYGVNNGSLYGYPYFQGWRPSRFRPLDEVLSEISLSEVQECLTREFQDK